MTEEQPVELRRSRRLAGLPPLSTVMNPAGKISPPSPNTPGQRYGEPCTFSGKAGEEVKEWLKRWCNTPPAAINATGFANSRAPEELQCHTNNYELRDDCMTAWQDLAVNLRPHVVREAPVCFHCGIRGHTARFCSECHRAPLLLYEQSLVLPWRTSTRGNYRRSPDSYYSYDFPLNYHSDSPVSVQRVTPPTSRYCQSPSPGHRHLISPSLLGN
ncbi:hypothetical protein HPB51_019617 [Rhipicephalus microplus]|uniref:CCHC-type domain-containing protein n=1 Tax=Rhipicephalus microplus TaxID=6941 RepID=A0A9J6DIC8_RHIMP|nr:hypothetical protein HPB51_019617 [Rhipicephalus microplus]